MAPNRFVSVYAIVWVYTEREVLLLIGVGVFVLLLLLLFLPCGRSDLKLVLRAIAVVHP